LKKSKFLTWSYLGLAIVLASAAFGQNLQLHYDLRREHLTSTLEIYKTDRLGALFTFVDFDYNREQSQQANGISSAYWEIARYFALPGKGAWSATLQYNDGLTNSFTFNPVWLVGLQKIFRIVTLDLPVDFLLRRELNTSAWTWQITAVWQKMVKCCEVAGFIDIWSTGKNGFPARRLAVMSEPQFWFYFLPTLAIGGEIEISYNFSGAWYKGKQFRSDSLFLLPTVGIKWNM